MANQQPPARPWLRLSSIARQTPAPEPPPPLSRLPFRPNAPPPQVPRVSTPTFPIPRVSASTSSPQSSPQQKQPITPAAAAAAQVPSTTKSPQSSPQQKKLITPPSPPGAADQVPSTTKSPQYSPQQKKPITPPSPAAAAAQVPSTTKSPKSSPQQKQPISTTSLLKSSSPKPLISDRKYSPSPLTPPRSPHTKLAPPPSPLTLPPSQMKSDTEPEPRFPPEVEQKNVLVHKTVEKANDKILNNPEITQNVNPKGKLNRNKSDSKEGGMRVISITGDNRGAIMELTTFPSPMKNGSYSTSDNQGKEDISKEKKNAMESHGMMNGYMNSNVQGVNNSILFNSTCVDHDPGLHLSFNRKPLGGGLYNHKNG